MVGTAIILGLCALFTFLADTNFREDITRPWRNQEK
jgi:hypothetical protein